MAISEVGVATFEDSGVEKSSDRNTSCRCTQYNTIGVSQVSPTLITHMRKSLYLCIM